MCYIVSNQFLTCSLKPKIYRLLTIEETIFRTRNDNYFNCASFVFTSLEMLYDDDDDPLLNLENELSESVTQETSCGRHAPSQGNTSINSHLQGIIFHCVAKPIVRFRWVVLGRFKAILLL